MNERILGYDSIFNGDWIRIEKRQIYRLINHNHDYCKIGYIAKDNAGTVAIIDRDMPIGTAPGTKNQSVLNDNILFSSSIVRESNQYYYKISDRCYLLIGFERDRRLHISLPALVHFSDDDTDLDETEQSDCPEDEFEGDEDSSFIDEDE